VSNAGFTFLKVVKRVTDNNGNRSIGTRIVINLNAAMSSFANSGLARDLTAALPAALALGVAGANPVASTAVGAAIAAGSTTFFSDLGKELAGGVQTVVNDIENGVGKVVTGVEDAVSAVAAPVVYGLGAFINAVA
jgi:hypothetical protein